MTFCSFKCLKIRVPIWSQELNTGRDLIRHKDLSLAYKNRLKPLNQVHVMRVLLVLLAK